MGRKIRFPLEMDDGVEVRSMEELRSNFSLEKVLEYIQNEKLLIWLRDRYENDIADAIVQLDKADTELPRKVSEIFDVPYDEKSEEDLKQVEERIARLKKFTDEKKFVNEIDKVAFDQDELYDLLDENAKEIYLCGDRFSIPLSMSGITYKGINNPTVVIDSKIEVDWISKKITLESVTFDEKYQSVLDRTKATQLVSVENMPEKTNLSFLIPDEDKDSVMQMYALAQKEISKLNYNLDTDIVEMKKLVYDSNLIGIADRYIAGL